eukprot:1395480-Pyramimonas_sp.AAC.1
MRQTLSSWYKLDSWNKGLNEWLSKYSSLSTSSLYMLINFGNISLFLAVLYRAAMHNWRSCGTFSLMPTLSKSKKAARGTA